MNLEVIDEYKLEELLSKLTVGQLKNIRRNLNLKIKNMSSLRKKELVEALAESIPQTVNDRAQLMDVDQYSAVITLMTRSGMIELDQLEMEDVFYLGSIGYAHPVNKDDKQILVMPKEIIDQFYKINPSQLKVVINKNQKITNILFGMMRYYGVIDVETAQSMIEVYFEEGIESSWFEQYINYLSEYYGGFHLIDGYIVDELALDLKEEIIEQQKRLDLAYCPISQEVMYSVNRLQWFEKTPQIEELAQYLNENYDLSNEQLEEMVNDFICMIQAQTPLSEILSHFGEKIELTNESDVKELVDNLVNVANHTRLWILKGFTPNELSPIEEKNTIPATSEKIGRNEPCPCNSGKKYKKCCAGK